LSNGDTTGEDEKSVRKGEGARKGERSLRKVQEERTLTTSGSKPVRN